MNRSSSPIRVLFVCMGNICRSPMAEALFRHKVEQAGLADRFEIDSAGTHAYHEGSAPHPETQEQLRLNEIEIGDGRSRVVTADDLESFDYVIAMDGENVENMAALSEAAPHAHVSRLLEWADGDLVDVPDPYYVGGYDRVFDLVDAGCDALLESICEREGLEVSA
jgi:protein-tyrosine phosphatase